MDLKLPPGLDRGATPYDSTDRWWDCNLIRWQDGVIRPIGGWDQNTPSPLASIPRFIHVWRNNQGIKYSLVGTETQLFAEDSSNHYTPITPSGFGTATGVQAGYGTFTYGSYAYGQVHDPAGGGDRPASTIFTQYFYWTMPNWGEDVIVCANSDQKAYYYKTATPTVAPVQIASAPFGVAVIVTDQRHLMIIGAYGGPLAGLGPGGSDGGGPRTVAWSKQEDYTTWDFSNPASTSGFQALSSDSILQVPYKVREGILILTQAEVFLSRYLGLPYIYGFERLAEISLMNPMSVATFNGQAIWMGREGFWHYAGGVVAPMACPIGNDIFTAIDPTWGPYRAFASENGMYPEVWFFYPEVGHTECNRCAIFNHQSGIWYWAQLSRSAMASAGAYLQPIAGAPSGHIYTHEAVTADGRYLDAGATRVGTVWVESGMIAAGQADRTLEVNQVMLGTGWGYNSLQLTAYSRMTQEGSERTFGPYSPRANGYTDTRISGRDVRLRFTAANDGEWAVGRARLEAVQGTGR